MYSTRFCVKKRIEMEQKKLNIAITTDIWWPQIGGTENVIANLMEEYSKHPNVENVFLYAPAFGNWQEVDTKVPYKVIRCKSMKLTKTVRLPILDKKSKHAVKNEKIDIIHCHTEFSLLNFSRKLARKLNVPLVVTTHTDYPKETPKDVPNKFVAKRVINYIIKNITNCDRLVCVTNMHREIVKGWGITRKLDVVHNASSLKAPVSRAQSIKQANERFGLKPDDNVLFFVARIERSKQPAFLLDVAHYLKNKGFSFKMVIAGKGGYLEHVSGRATEEGLTDVVNVAGFVSNEDRDNLYARGDLFVFPSTGDTAGLVVRDAAVCDVPSLVLADQPTAEGIIDGQNGYTSSLDAEVFGDKIIEIFKDKNKLKTCGINANKSLSRTWRQAADDYIELYKQAISEKSKQ